MAQTEQAVTPAKQKTTRKPAATKGALKLAKKPAATKTAKAARPVVMQHNFSSRHDGPSDVVNARPSRQKIDFSRFGTLKSAALTNRDQAAIEVIRKEFGQKAFERGNMDTGILRRLGERGVISHVSGDGVDPKATFKLTAKGSGQVTA